MKLKTPPKKPDGSTALVVGSLAFIVLPLLAAVAGAIGLIYVVCHFIAKFW